MYTMKICITSQGTTIDAAVDPRFGRAACFLIVDPSSREVTVVENDAINSSGGAGIAAARQVIDFGVSAVLTGNCGPNAFRTLQAGGIQVFTGISGTVSDAVEAYCKGTLTADEQASVDSHAGMGPQE